MLRTNLRFWVVCWAALWSASLTNAAPALVQIAEGERVVHVVASPFGQEGSEPRLETMLLRRYSALGLKYRRVKNDLSEVAKDLEATVLLHQPTLVLLQTGNRDLVRERHYVFTEYPKHLAQVVTALTQKGIRVVVCSPVPIGSDSTKSKLVFPIDEMSRWVVAARQIAESNRAPFVDLFTDAIEWKMSGTGRASHYFTAAEHRKSFELLLSQLRFDPSRLSVELDLRSRSARADLAEVQRLEWGESSLRFTLAPRLGEAATLFRIAGLRPGQYAVTVGTAAPATWSSGDLEQGVELAVPVTAPDLRMLKSELDRGQSLGATLSQIKAFTLPTWVTLADATAQKDAAWKKYSDELDRHDSRLAELCRPPPVQITVTPRSDGGSRP